MTAKDTELEVMVGIARRAGALVAELHQRHLDAGLEVELKGPNDPVTQADREANALICGALAEAFPDALVVGEESAPSGEDLARLKVAPRIFFVDPLDGTREFVDGRPEFAVMIGLAEQGRAAAGVVLEPVTGRLSAGRVGAEAFLEDAAGARTSARVSACERFDQATMMVSRSHRPAIIEPLRKRLGIGQLLPSGSVGVKVARLVDRSADLYVHAGPGLKLWDTCAPEAILVAAGGRVSDLVGASLRYDEGRLPVNGGFVASNGVLHPGLLSAVSWAEAQAARQG